MSRASDYVDLIDIPRDMWDPGDWSARNRSIASIDTFELHHTGAAGPRSMSFEDKQRWLLSIERYHEGTKGWSDIFYHLFVFADGEVWEGRRADRYAQSDIKTTLCVHIPGNNQRRTQAQFDSMLSIARWVTDNPNNLTTHWARALGSSRPSACPGQNGILLVDELRAALKGSTVADHTHEYQNLASFPEAVNAKSKGTWDGSNPAMAASRSTVAVMIDRVDERLSNQIEALQSQVAELETVGNEIIVDREVLDLIVAEIIKRLEE